MVCEVVKRVRALREGALFEAQSKIDDRKYLGSGKLVRCVVESAGRKNPAIIAGDRCRSRRERLRACGFTMLDEMTWGSADYQHQERFDAYANLIKIAQIAECFDLVLIDPFRESMDRWTTEVFLAAATISKVASVLLFILEPKNQLPRFEFDQHIKQVFGTFWRISCPKIPDTNVRGESNFDSEIVLSSHLFRKEYYKNELTCLKKRVTKFIDNLSDAINLPENSLTLEIIGEQK